jgi:uncharacterized protein YdgA (DUF945 family)
LVVRKGFVALLLVLAVVVLVSPGIVGKIAEQSMHENLEFAATEANEVTITSQGFDRGWFSSAGQHRLELRDGELYDTLLLMVGDEIDALPALIIDTHIDHGIVPVTSMTRAQGSLAPGLGSAVSTLTLELADRSTIDLPGAIYSEIGLSGALTSKLVLEPGSFADGDETAHWGAVDIEVTTNPTTGRGCRRGIILNRLDNNAVRVGHRHAWPCCYRIERLRKRRPPLRPDIHPARRPAIRRAGSRQYSHRCIICGF